MVRFSTFVVFFYKNIIRLKLTTCERMKLLYFKTVSVFMHDVSNHITSENLCDAFTHSRQIHSYDQDQLLLEVAMLNRLD